MHGWNRDPSLSTTIIEAVAAVSENEPIEMDPLYSIVDLDVVDDFFNSLRQSTHQNGDGRVELTVDGHQVAVLSSGAITIRQDSTDGTRDGPMNENEFQLALARLLRDARANGVDLEGGWSCPTEADSTLGIEIYEVDKEES